MVMCTAKVASSIDLAMSLQFDPDVLANYTFELPDELIARFPPLVRGDSRMLVVDPLTRQMRDDVIRNLPSYLRNGDRLFFNNTRVMKARLFGKKLSGGAIEILIERVLDKRTVLAQMGVSKKPRTNQEIELEDGTRVVVGERQGLFWVLKLMGAVFWPEVMERIGHIPLPPYLQRADEANDQERYQTVYAKNAGSVAAPTAGLHFDANLLSAVEAAGARRFELTLQVGAGTFAPIRADKLSDHRMHREHYHVNAQTLTALAQKHGRRLAVGTTSLRTLESLPLDLPQTDVIGETDIFIKPGYAFKHIDGLLTNFHLPQSSLLVLVCAVAGTEFMLSAYQHAITERYRFYSYGDCMLILPGALA